MSPIPNCWVSIDPGDRHVGWAMWNNAKPIEVAEVTPELCVSTLEKLLGIIHPYTCQLDLIVIERFQLYAWNEKSLAGNEFKTSQLIGVVKYLANRARVELVPQYASEGKLTYNRAPFKHWKARQWPSYGMGTHAKDAVAHGYAFLWRRGYQPA